MCVWLNGMFSQTPHWAAYTPSAPVSADLDAMYVDTITNILYLGGRFEYIGGKHCRGAARWNGTTWDSMGIGFDRDNLANFAGTVKKILRYKNKIYYFGTFDQAGPYNTKGMAIWNGTAWDSIGSSFPNGYILDADIYQDTMYVCGAFSKIGTLTTSCVAKFDGANWYSLSFPLGPYGIRAYKNKIYVIGAWYQNGYSLTAEWDYVNGWKPSLGVQGNTAKTLNGLERVDTLLYFYGRFTHLSTMYSPCIAGYSGTRVYGLGAGGGLNNYPTIYKLKNINNKTYILGMFESMGGMAIPGTNLGVAELSGNQYCIYGDNFDNVVSDMVKYNNELIISGSFWQVNTDSVKKIAKWIGGNYTYSCSTFTPAVSGIATESSDYEGVTISPNPFNDKVYLKFNDYNNKSIKITDLFGSIVFEYETGSSAQEINLANLSSGLYIVTVYCGQSKVVFKIAKE